MKLFIRFIIGLAIIAGIIYLLNMAGCFEKQPPVIPIGKIDTLHGVNKAGDSVISLKGNEQDFGAIEKRIADSIAGVYSTKVKDLKELIIAQTRTIAELTAAGPIEKDYSPDTSHKDCPPVIKNMRQTFTNPYYTARVQIGDSSYMHLAGYDTITALWKRVREGNIFNRKTYLQLDISHANPDTKVTGLLAYRVPDPKPKKFGIGLSAGVTWIDKWRPYAGLGLNWNIIRF